LVSKKEELEKEKYMERVRARRKTTPRKRKKRAKPKPARTRARASPQAIKKSSSKSRAQREVVKKSPTPVTDDTQSRFNELSMKIGTLNQNINGINNKIQYINTDIKDLENRISGVRRENYVFLNHLEQDYASLFAQWEKKKPDINNEIVSQVNSLLSQVRRLEPRIHNLDIHDADLLESQISQLNNLRFQLESYVDSELHDFRNDQSRISKDLVLIEKTLDLLKNSSIKWKNGEHPVLSIRSHDLNNDQHGVLTLTNHRILFEEEKEIVLKKRFLIVTEKKIVREIQIDQPIGAIEKIIKGQVGFFKGSGAFITFKPELGIHEYRFDTNDDDVNNLIRSFNYIITGLADKDLGSKEIEETDDRIIQCPFCSAPYNKEVYRGQTSLECEYCGTSFRA
jgi:CRISPR/Cas system-associated exonuclease Cas4 (RecB family)